MTKQQSDFPWYRPIAFFKKHPEAFWSSVMSSILASAIVSMLTMNSGDDVRLSHLELQLSEARTAIEALKSGAVDHRLTSLQLDVFDQRIVDGAMQSQRATIDQLNRRDRKSVV